MSDRRDQHVFITESALCFRQQENAAYMTTNSHASLKQKLYSQQVPSSFSKPSQLWKDSRNSTDCTVVTVSVYNSFILPSCFFVVCHTLQTQSYLPILWAELSQGFDSRQKKKLIFKQFEKFSLHG